MEQDIMVNNVELVLNTSLGNNKIEVLELKQEMVLHGTAYLLATLYQVKGGFIPQKVYVFKASDVDEVTVDVVKQLADFYFQAIIKSDLYVKEVPQDSAFFAQEAERLFGKEVVCA